MELFLRNFLLTMRLKNKAQLLAYPSASNVIKFWKQRGSKSDGTIMSNWLKGFESYVSSQPPFPDGYIEKVAWLAERPSCSIKEVILLRKFLLKVIECQIIINTDIIESILCKSPEIISTILSKSPLF